MIKDDFYIVLQYIFKSTTSSVWKNKENRKLPGYKKFSRNNIYANK